eukprot:CAMPEP_0194228794 /NCGR_PEP_ID=MMETSP0156-20130528/43557_1 /TAXON_ID=33649 /ORGANISM="Thalassionema nitzschioides, Strain L26-B" /LENGTH=424 /DNA_ID=CAMNT_0038961315 /DNA_START=141 /DNA_END=1416 /DNA_ORIENTATION=+
MQRHFTLLPASAENYQANTNLTRTKVRRMRVAELREGLASRGLETSGVRNILVQRLIQFEYGNPSDGSKDKEIFRDKESYKDEKSKPTLSAERLYVLQFRGHTPTSISEAGVGLVLYDAELQEEIWSGRKYFSQRISRFEAEYKGITIGLKIAQSLGVQRLVLQGDNKVILNQIGGTFNVKKDNLRKLYWSVIALKEDFEQCEVQCINSIENNKAKMQQQELWQPKNLKVFINHFNKSQLGDDEDSNIRRTPKKDTSSEDAHLSKFPENNDGIEAATSLDPNTRYLLRFDGGSRGNPGLSGAGMVLYDDKHQEVWCGWKFLDYEATNNDAEYTGLILGLKCALSLGITSLRVEGDSELIVRQLEGRYRIKSPRLQELWGESKELISKFNDVKIRHIPRAKNKRADELANQAMDCRDEFGFEEIM